MWASLKEGPSLHWEMGVVEMALLLPKSESLLCEGRVFSTIGRWPVYFSSEITPLSS